MTLGAVRTGERCIMRVEVSVGERGQGVLFVKVSVFDATPVRTVFGGAL